ncbi:class I SAM-dependent methyltransferase [Rhodobacteraceae bacterium ASV31]|nr:class I SAM-dependent methyltransferase [Anianabacter salinae]
MTDRLPLALDAGAVPDGATAVAVFGPVAGQDLSPLGPERAHVVQGFRPDHDWFRAAGYRTDVAPQDSYDAAIVCVPRSKDAARGAIAEALTRTKGGPVLVDGQKDDGIESLLKECRAACTLEGSLSKAHGKLFWITGTAPEAWRAKAMPDAVEGGFVTTAGVFSADGIDPASRLLEAALPRKLPKRVVDLGAGWGYLSRAILERDGVAALHLVEADHVSLDCARRNVTDARAVFHWDDATAFGPAGGYDAVVTNPPFHRGRAPDPAIGRSFIEAAARMLTPGGRLWFVANRHLPYEKAAAELFAEVNEIAGDTAFKVIEASKPRRIRR